jgi:hypothetical protein
MIRSGRQSLSRVGKPVHGILSVNSSLLLLGLTQDNEWAVEVLNDTNNHEASLTFLPILPTESSPKKKRSSSNPWQITL